MSWVRDSSNRLHRVTSSVESSIHSLEIDSSSVFSLSEPGDEIEIESENMAAPAPRTLKDYLQPTRTTTPSCIILPENAPNFSIKHGMMSVIPQFHGMDSESPYQHLTDFELACATFITRAVTDEFIRLRLFPFSLKDKAKIWFNSLRPNSISSWSDMQREFLQKNFHFQRT